MADLSILTLSNHIAIIFFTFHNGYKNQNQNYFVLHCQLAYFVIYAEIAEIRKTN